MTVTHFHRWFGDADYKHVCPDCFWCCSTFHTRCTWISVLLCAVARVFLSSQAGWKTSHRNHTCKSFRQCGFSCAILELNCTRNIFHTCHTQMASPPCEFVHGPLDVTTGWTSCDNSCKCISYHPYVFFHADLRGQPAWTSCHNKCTCKGGFLGEFHLHKTSWQTCGCSDYQSSFVFAFFCHLFWHLCLILLHPVVELSLHCHLDCQIRRDFPHCPKESHKSCLVLIFLDLMFYCSIEVCFDQS